MPIPAMARSKNCLSTVLGEMPPAWRNAPPQAKCLSEPLPPLLQSPISLKCITHPDDQTHGEQSSYPTTDRWNSLLDTGQQEQKKLFSTHHLTLIQAYSHQQNSQSLSQMDDPADEIMLNQLRLLNLHNKGKEISKLSEQAESSLLKGWKYNLIGKLLPPPTALPRAIMGAAKRALNIMYDDDFNMEQTEADLIILKFRKETDKDRAFHKQPIILYNSVLLIAEWDGHTRPRDIVLDKFLCWVRVQMRLPTTLTEELAKDFLHSIGEIAEIEGKRTFIFELGKARAYVHVKSSEPLCTLTARQTRNGDTLLASFQYEKIRTICYLCGKIDHTLNVCPKRRFKENQKLTTKDFHPETHLWGEFVLASDWSPSKWEHRQKLKSHLGSNDMISFISSQVPETQMIMATNDEDVDLPKRKRPRDNWSTKQYQSTILPDEQNDGKSISGDNQSINKDKSKLIPPNMLNSLP